MLLNPHVGAQPFYLLPQAVQILLLRMRMVGPEDAQRVVMNLLPALDVALQAAQHAVQLALLLLVELAAHPGQGGEDAVGEPIAADLGHALLQSRVHKVVEELEQRAGGDHVTVHQVGHETEQKAGVRPLAALQAVLFIKKLFLTRTKSARV